MTGDPHARDVILTRDDLLAYAAGLGHLRDRGAASLRSRLALRAADCEAAANDRAGIALTGAERGLLRRIDERAMEAVFRPTRRGLPTG